MRESIGTNNLATEKCETDSPNTLTECQKLIQLLKVLRRESESYESSSRQVLIDHAVLTCEVYLQNLLDEARHQHFAQQSHRRNKDLAKQLHIALDLLGNSDLSTSTVNTDGFANSGEKIGKRVFLSRAGVTDNRIYVEFFLFNGFKVILNDSEIANWPKGKSKLLLKYLIVNRHAPVTKEVLMDVFWPQHDFDSARNNLNVAVYSLRRAFRKEIGSFPTILFQDGCYFLNPQMHMWLDIEEFDKHLKRAKKLLSFEMYQEALENLTFADELYKGDVLNEDIYTDWTTELRIDYKEKYIEVLKCLDEYYLRDGNYEACLEVNKRITLIDSCNELAHHRLMEIYSDMGQRNLALRQYQICAETLNEELGLEPAEVTKELFTRIKDYHPS